MPRPVDEILRDARERGSPIKSSGQAMFRAYIGELTPEQIARRLTDDPAERAALVEHMVASRGAK